MDLRPQLGVLVLQQIRRHLLPQGVVVQTLPLLFYVPRTHPAHLQVQGTGVFGIKCDGPSLVASGSLLLVVVAEGHCVVAEAVRGRRPLLEHQRGCLRRVAII